jgi:signal transduction histidine kinase
MEYVYMQQPKPNNATGVEVVIDVMDANGNYRNIGTTISDDSGFFTYTWTPDISGDYVVYASFCGSESYYGTSAETSFYASDPAATPAPSDAPVQSTADMYFVPAVAAIIVVIVVCFAITILMLRKRP